MKRLLQCTGLEYSDLPDVFKECVNADAGDKKPFLIEVLDDNGSRSGLLEEIYDHIHTQGVKLTKQVSDSITHMLKVDENYEMSPPHVRLVSLVEQMGVDIDVYTRRICGTGLWRQTYSSKPMEVATFWADKDGTPVSNPERRKMISGNIKPAKGRIVMVDAEDGSDPLPALCVTDNINREGNHEEILMPIVTMLGDALYGQMARITGSKFLGLANIPLSAFYAVASELAAQGLLEDKDNIYGLKALKKEAPRKLLSAEENPDALIEIGSWS